MNGRVRPLEIAWQGRTAASAQSSYDGAVAAQESSELMCATLRRFYRTRGYAGATDAETEMALGWPPNIVTARRNDLIDAGQVVVRWPASRRESIRARGRSGRAPIKVTVWVLASVVGAGSDTEHGHHGSARRAGAGVGVGAPDGGAQDDDSGLFLREA